MKAFVLSLLAAHFIGDWILQSREVAINKSKYFRVLLHHTAIVTACLLFAVIPFVPQDRIIALLCINWATHIVIDWFGWRFYKRKFGNLPMDQHLNNYWFYTTIALDQFAHLSILFLIFL